MLTTKRKTESSCRVSGDSQRKQILRVTIEQLPVTNLSFNSATRQFWYQPFYFNLKAASARAAKRNGCWSSVNSEDCLNHEPLSVSVRFFRHSASNFFTCAESQASFSLSPMDVLFSFLIFYTHILVLNADRWQRSPLATKMWRWLRAWNSRTGMFCHKKPFGVVFTSYSWLFTPWRAKELGSKKTFLLITRARFKLPKLLWKL